MGVNGIGIGVNTFNVATQLKEGDVPVLAIFQLAASTLFFTNSVVNFQHASSIIKDAQKSHLANVRNQLSEEVQRVEFDRQILQDRQDNLPKGKTGEMHGAEVTIGRLNELMQNPDWKMTFGGDNSKNLCM